MKRHLPLSLLPRGRTFDYLSASFFRYRRVFHDRNGTQEKGRQTKEKPDFQKFLLWCRALQPTCLGMMNTTLTPHMVGTCAPVPLFYFCLEILAFLLPSFIILPTLLFESRESKPQCIHHRCGSGNYHNHHFVLNC